VKRHFRQTSLSRKVAAPSQTPSKVENVDRNVSSQRTSLRDEEKLSGTFFRFSGTFFRFSGTFFDFRELTFI
jgi:hypothetical protein